MKVQLKHIDGVTFLGKGDTNHWVSVDGPTSIGGSEAGSRPKELLLMSLGSCTGSDVASILKKKQAPIDYFEIEVQADIAEEHPKVFTKIHISYLFYGEDIKKQDVIRAIDLSQNKYCPIISMLKHACDITSSFEIISKKND